MREPADTVNVPALRSPFITPVEASSTAEAASMLPSEFTADGDGLRLHAAGQFRARLDRQVAFDVHIALEVTGDADVARAFDLAFDREPGRDDRFFLLHSGCSLPVVSATGRAGGGGGWRSGSLKVGVGMFGTGAAPGLSVSFQSAISVGSFRLDGSSECINIARAAKHPTGCRMQSQQRFSEICDLHLSPSRGAAC